MKTTQDAIILSKLAGISAEESVMALKLTIETFIKNILKSNGSPEIS